MVKGEDAVLGLSGGACQWHQRAEGVVGDRPQHSGACSLALLALGPGLPLHEPPVPCSARYCMGLGTGVTVAQLGLTGSHWVCEAAAFCASVVELQAGGVLRLLPSEVVRTLSSQSGAVLQ